MRFRVVEAILCNREAPWERAQGESARRYAAFCLYRDLGPRRTLSEAWRLYCGDRHSVRAGPPRPKRGRTSPPGHWKRWAEEGRWRERAEAWDGHCERISRADREATVRELERLRLEFELEQHHRLTAKIQRLEEYLESLFKLPPTEVFHVRPDGSTVRVRALAPAQIVRVMQELRQAVAQVILGHKRVTLSVRPDSAEVTEAVTDALGEVLPIDLRLEQG